jgi:hypothetical protein
MMMEQGCKEHGGDDGDELRPGGDGDGDDEAKTVGEADRATVEYGWWSLAMTAVMKHVDVGDGVWRRRGLA